MKPYTYSYTVLQYRHDVWSGECLNVGVLMVCPAAAYVKLQTRRAGHRLTSAFPGINRRAFREDLKALENWFDKNGPSTSGLLEVAAAHDLGLRVLGNDDSSLNWQLDGSGVTDDPVSTHAQLFDRFVARYDQMSARQPRTDEQVFETVKAKLESARLFEQMQPHTVRSQFSEFTFPHALKNGAWHCIQAVSFDSADADQMKKKANIWAGELVALESAPRDFSVYFVTGKPSNAGLLKQYDKVRGLLSQSPTSPIVVEEENSSSLVEQLVALH